jgi:SEC-C motif-containing protein
MKNKMCPCGKNLKFDDCCYLYLSGTQRAPDAETLMRSRYSAFVTKNYDYLLKTHDPATLEHFDLASNKAWAESVEFVKLEILNSDEQNNEGFVEFNAFFIPKKENKVRVHNEHSLFTLKDGQWYYTSVIE